MSLDRDGVTDEDLTKLLGDRIGGIIDRVAMERGSASPLGYCLVVVNTEGGSVHYVTNSGPSVVMTGISAVLELLVAEHRETVGKPAAKPQLDS